MNNPVNVAVLGATGSIGTATAEVIAHLQKADPTTGWQMWAASAHRNIDCLAEMIENCVPGPERIILSDEASAAAFQAENNSIASERVRVGADALAEVAQDARVDCVVAAIVGRAGLESTLAAVDAGKRVALANKETMVMAGPLVRESMVRSGAEILPVDSEHSAIFQCLGPWASATAISQTGSSQTVGSQTGSSQTVGSQTAGSQTATFPATGSPATRQVLPDSGQDDSGQDLAGDCKLPAKPPGPRKLILTASGGPFRTWTGDQIASATPDQALAHPTWDMGRKISIDSATMMNKALEIIEARWLFDFPADSIEVVVHPQSIIHSMVEFDDGSVIAQMSPPDMKLPIQYALTYPRRLPCPSPALDRNQSWNLNLEPADLDRFPALRLGFEVAAAGGSAGAVVNAANEVAVGLFLDGQIRFTDIVSACEGALENHTFENHPTLSRLVELDKWAREETLQRFK